MTIPSKKVWQKILKAHPEANFLQSPEWAEVNQKIGHKVIIEAFDDETLTLAVIKNAKRGRYLEVPGGPLLDWEDSEMVETVFARLRQIAKDNKCSVSTVKRAINELVKKGYIEKINRRRPNGSKTSNRYMCK